MRTSFAEARLADPDIRDADRILRTCVHCGFCLATCPTYLLQGDERDSPRGRIYLAKEMLESGGPATPAVVRHLDRCLTCRSCMTTCPSGVDYAHLVEPARARIEKTYRRPVFERLLRQAVATAVANPGLFRAAALAGLLGRPLMKALPAVAGHLLAALPKRVGRPSWVDRPQVIPAKGPRRRRVALLAGCAQQVVRPEINEATARVLTRHGCEVVVAHGAGCCGALFRHMGWEERARRAARANVAAWSRAGDLDAIVVNASGCGVALKDYGVWLRGDDASAGPAERVASLVRDVSEVLMDLGLQPPARPTGQAVTYQMACTMQHGLAVRIPPKVLLQQAGFVVREPTENHICCGSAGIYWLLQREFAERLRKRKLAHIEATAPAIIATGNVGCLTWLEAKTRVPVVHTVELLDWATGGPEPAALASQPGR